MPTKERFRAKEEREKRRLAEVKSRDIAREFRNKKALGAKEREKTKVGSSPAAESLSRGIADKFKRTKEIENPKNRDRRAEEVRRLHFEEGLTQEEVAKRLGVSVHTIYRTFKKQGWEPRHSTRRKELDENTVRRLYYDEGLTQEKVAEKLGVSESTIYRHFRKHNMKPHRIDTRNEVDSKEVHRLHFEEKLSRKEVAEKLDVSERTISRIFRDQGWEAHGQTKYQNENERELARRENRKNTQMKVIELREKLFGTKCQICTEERKIAVHRKDGSEHNPNDLWRISNLRTVNPDEYAAVCIPCHRGVHWMMRTYGQNWAQIKSQSLMEPLSKQKIREPLNLPDESEPSSQTYLKLKPRFEGSEEEIRRALFGENCQICGSRYDEKQLYLHRKDGRPHSSGLTMKEKFFRTLDAKEWVFLCYSDHRGVHWAKKALGLEWGDLKRKEDGAEGEI